MITESPFNLLLFAVQRIAFYLGLLEAGENVYQNLNKNSFWFWVSPVCSKAVSSCSAISQLVMNVEKKMIMRFHKAMTTLERARSPFCQFANTVDSGCL